MWPGQPTVTTATALLGYRPDEPRAIHEGERVLRHRREFLVRRAPEGCRKRYNQLRRRRRLTVSDQPPERVGRRRHQRDIARLRMEHDPVFRVVVVGPDQIRCRTKVRFFRYVHVFEARTEPAQLAEPPPAKTVLPRTVASTTGRPTKAARRRKARRSSSSFGTGTGGCSERSRSGRELSAIRLPATAPAETLRPLSLLPGTI